MAGRWKKEWRNLLEAVATKLFYRDLGGALPSPHESQRFLAHYPRLTEQGVEQTVSELLFDCPAYFAVLRPGNVGAHQGHGVFPQRLEGALNGRF